MGKFFKIATLITKPIKYVVKHPKSSGYVGTQVVADLLDAGKHVCNFVIIVYDAQFHRVTVYVLKACIMQKLQCIIVALHV